MALEGKGFEIALDAACRTIRVRTWGCWDLEFAKRYKSALHEKLAEIQADGMQWQGIVDLSCFSASSDEVWTLMQERGKLGRRGEGGVAVLKWSLNSSNEE